jgi:hypothetical protein
MNRLKAAPIAAAVAVIAAGCGGAATSGSGSAATDPTHSTTATTTDDGGTTLESVSSTQQMRAYFRHVDRVRQQLVITRRSTLALNAAIKVGDGTAAGAAARSAAAGVRKALIIAKRIKPDEPLRTIHSELLANLRLGVVYLNRMASDIESQDQSRIRRWPKTVLPTLRRSERWYAEWATNSAAIASSLGVRPPHWLHTMDRWN